MPRPHVVHNTRFTPSQRNSYGTDKIFLRFSKSLACYSTAMSTVRPSMVSSSLFESYDPGNFHDEMFSAPGNPRSCYSKMLQKLSGMAPEQFEERRHLADLSFLMQGITFTVYSDGRGTERLFPFDLIPRILPQSEWARIERGLAQRVLALNLFLQDIYGQQRILKDGQISRPLVYSCRNFHREMIGIEVPRGIHIHISASTWCAIPVRASSWSWKTMRGFPVASLMFWRTAW